MNEEILPTSQLGSIMMILETLFLLRYADKRYDEGNPIVDEFYIEMGSAQFLEKALKNRYYHIQSIHYRLKRLRKLGFIRASGVTYTNNKKRVPKSNGKGRSFSKQKYLVYEVTDIGNRFFEDNSYMLIRFNKINDLESRLEAFSSIHNENKKN